MRYKPFLALLFLSPITAEFLTGSSPPLSIFNPLSLLFLLGLYGCGANIVRELTKRWGGGWSSILLLGAAYGVIEEGLAAKSFFDPNWPDLGYLAVFGRWLGVNWVWSEWLIIFHAIVSIAAPIMLVELIFPKQSNERWLSGRALALSSAVFAFVVVFMFLFISNFYPNIIQITGCLLAVFVFAFLAKRSSAKYQNKTGFSETRPVKFFLLSAFMVPFFFFFFTGGPYIIHSPPLLMAIGGIAAFCFWRIYSAWGRLPLKGIQRFAAAAGFTSLWIGLEPIIELNKGAKDETGLVLVGIAYAVFLIALGMRIRKRDSENVSS